MSCCVGVSGNRAEGTDILSVTHALAEGCHKPAVTLCHWHCHTNHARPPSIPTTDASCCDSLNIIYMVTGTRHNSASWTSPIITHSKCLVTNYHLSLALADADVQLT